MAAPRISLKDWWPPDDVKLACVVARPRDGGWEFEGRFIHRKPPRVPRRPRCEPFAMVAFVDAEVVAEDEGLVLTSSMVARQFSAGIRREVARIAAEDRDAAIVRGARRLPVAPPGMEAA